jgi:hypothetical protein
VVVMVMGHFVKTVLKTVKNGQAVQGITTVVVMMAGHFVKTVLKTVKNGQAVQGITMMMSQLG